MGAARQAVERSCVGCRRVRPKAELIRFVLAPDGRLVVDPRHRLPGRGAYTCPDRECVGQAVRRRQFARALRQPVAPIETAELLEILEASLKERVLGLVALARKAGQVVSGSSMVLKALGGRTDLDLVLIARDTAAGTADAVAGKANAVGVEHRVCFEKVDLGKVLGKEERSVVAVRKHPLAERLRQELIRFTHIAGEN